MPPYHRIHLSNVIDSANILSFLCVSFTQCLWACWGSAFISYRVASELPLARLLFDELNHTVTPGGHRVTIYWDAHRLVKVIWACSSCHCFSSICLT